MKKTILFFLALATFITVSAQTTNKTISDETLLKAAARYKMGINCDVNTEKAVAIYKQLARKHNPRAMYELGKMYLHGDGVETDYNAALQLFNGAAHADVSPAYNQLAYMHQKGLGVPINMKRAYNYYQQSAEKGNPQGYYGMGYLLYKGLGAEQNYEQAVGYLEKGAEKGHGACSFLLGVYYANGYSGTADYEKAEHYFNLASKAGHGWTIDVTKYGWMDALKTGAEELLKKFESTKAQLMTGGKLRLLSNMTTLNAALGDWEGQVYTLDWSKSHLLSKKAISLTFEEMADSIGIKWYENDTLKTIFTPTLQQEQWREHKKKSYQEEFKFVVTDAEFEKSGNRLYASMRVLDLKRHEYLKPLFAVLTQKGFSESETSETSFTLDKISTGSNTLEITLTSSAAQDISVQAVSALGLKSTDLGSFTLQNGENTLQISHSLRKGFYVLHVSGTTGNEAKVITIK